MSERNNAANWDSPNRVGSRTDPRDRFSSGLQPLRDRLADRRSIDSRRRREGSLHTDQQNRVVLIETNRNRNSVSSGLNRMSRTVLCVRHVGLDLPVDDFDSDPSFSDHSDRCGPALSPE
ncbi:hypothetical protein JCM9743_20550 [Natrinema sp. JCM 9743]